MFYLVQENLFREVNYDNIIRTLERLGLDYEICKFEQFEDHRKLIFQTDRKDVWCFGAIKMAHVAREYGFEPGSMYNENHDFEVYAPKYGDNMLNNDAFVMKFGDPLPADVPSMFFARPCADTKAFSGQVFMPHSWNELVESTLEADEKRKVSTHPKNMQVMISSLKEIQQEYRTWVVGDKVVTMSQYRLGRRVIAKNADHEEDVREFAQKMVDIYRPAEAFVLDVARTDDGLRIVEINCINCAGIYDANLQKLIVALEEHFTT